ncbi:MAG: type 4a pilus biogenesis protein PilO [Magnetococcales bacterium]|nr:type 4a pilus biogenesis protein PilO [Magnetococcales bacterium]
MELGFDPGILLRFSPLKKIGIGIVVLLMIAACYWHFLFKDQQKVMDGLQDKITKLEEEIQFKKSQLKKLPVLRQELEELKLLEAEAARKLPSRKEIPTLLTDISNAGHEQGLTFLLFAPKPEMPADIHAEVPVDLQFLGSYLETAHFLQTVARMPRIVTITDLLIAPGKNDTLQTQAKAVTYRFLDAEELEAQARKASEAKAKKSEGQAKKGK